MYLSGGHCNSSGAEVGVLMAITGHGPTPPPGGGTHYDDRGGQVHQGSETLLTYPVASPPCTCGALGTGC
ncbi:hypothetical protein AVEN_57207-1, partial [Araneus ventricosus]